MLVLIFFFHSNGGSGFDFGFNAVPAAVQIPSVPYPTALRYAAKSRVHTNRVLFFDAHTQLLLLLLLSPSSDVFAYEN